MPYRKVDIDNSVTDQLAEGEDAFHIHHGVDETHALTLLDDKETDTDYDGEPFECGLCGVTVDYPKEGSDSTEEEVEGGEEE